MSIRSVCTSAAAALGIACSSGSFARTLFVHAAYVPTAVVYVPPLAAQSPTQFPVYAPTPGYALPSVAIAVPVLQQPLPAGAVPIPLPVAVSPAPAAITPGYALVPAANIAYAQPVLTVPAIPAAAAH